MLCSCKRYDEAEQTARVRAAFKLGRYDAAVLSNDPVRSENEKTARHLDRLIEESYQLMGYDIIHVPLRSIEARTEFILEHL